ncbi:MAG: hypothetical protein ABSB69_17655 [Solirubrobacteraceae bacterium]
MTIQATDRLTSVGIVQLIYSAPRTPGLSGAALAIAVSELQALHTSAMLFAAHPDDAERTLVNTVMDMAGQSLPDRPMPAGLPVALLGARALCNFDTELLTHDSKRTERTSIELAGRGVMAPLPLRSVSFSSPLEVVIAIPLVSATVVIAYAILVEAIGRLYRGARGLEVDQARIDAMISHLNANQADSELRQQLSQEIRRQASAGVDDLSPASSATLPIESAEATIEDN